MTRYIAVLFNGIILLLEGVGLMDPNSILHWFMSVTLVQILFHLIISTILLLYALFPHVRYRITQIAILFGGLGLFLAGIAAIASPNFWGYNSNILLVVDIFFLVEIGILAMLVALELPIRQSVHTRDEVTEKVSGPQVHFLSSHSA